MIQHRYRVVRRRSEFCGEFRQVIASATAAATAMRELSATLDRLGMQIRLALADKWDPQGRELMKLLPIEADRFEGLARLATLLADIPSDRGGRPQFVAFKKLVQGLAQAFKRARGRPAKVTFNPVTNNFEGSFLHLLEAALPLAAELASRNGSAALDYPATPEARGKYVHRLTANKATA